MTEAEQDLILFFKLYLLARRNMYIDYMRNAKILMRWFNFNVAGQILIDQAPVYCGHCFNEVGRTIGGGFSMSCSTCKQGNNMAYEIQQLSMHTGLNWYLCIYLMVRAVEEIYKCNNVHSFKSVIHH